ncbi:MAG: cation transporting ATPase C-terminal domain-containing protein [Patescibacteria group bacterium]
MLSLAALSMFLPFLPMLPAQILLLNLLSDLPMLGITSDKVADEDLAKPHSWNIKTIARYMYFFGPISSIADFMTFGMLYFLVGAGTNLALFRSGWFVESLITEVVVIFLLRSRRTSLNNLPSKILTTACVMAIVISLVIVYSPLGNDFELIGLPAKVLAYIAIIVIGYGMMVELGKRGFYKYIVKE